MINVNSVEIQELRGIRKLVLRTGGKNFVIAGPNGSGKSGVVDAIEFGLTGEIGRLMGKGTGGIKLATHGPHVDKRDYPDASFVRLEISIPSLGKSATVTRRIKKPKEAELQPNDPAIRAVLDEVAQHPEVTLSRREIIKFILTEATQRSRDVQTLLKLDEIDETRSTLKTTQNKLNALHSAAEDRVSGKQDAVRRHFDLSKLEVADVLAAVNARRKLLELQELAKLETDTSVSAGITEAARKATPGVNKETALRDLAALRDGTADSERVAGAVDRAVEKLKLINENPGLLEAIELRSFVETGLGLVDSAACPLCDKAWEIDALRSHLQEKLKKSEDAEKLQQALLASGRELASEVERLQGLIATARLIAKGEDAENLQTILGAWRADLRTFGEHLSSVKDLLSVKARLEGEWKAEPAKLQDEIKALEEKIAARPDESATVDAQSFLVVAQERLGELRRVRREEHSAKVASEAGKAAYKAYCKVAEQKLSGLYEKVQSNFCEYYRAINRDDEGDFTASLSAEDGKLDLSVDFYKRGMFPPGAYHSEGHQDSMGVCLYLALMKQLFGKEFTFAVLDDVVMSVDAGHRRQFCKLLKTEFPNTQFIITTHDKVWGRQMRSEGLVTSKSSISFYGWTIDGGPIVEQVGEVWDEIEAELAKGNVADAAGKLRRHLEFCANDLADLLGARVTHRADGNYELGDLLPAVISRQKELLGKAAKSAQDWGNDDAKGKVKEFQEELSKLAGASGVERWAVNAAVHYNAWADFSKADFEPVVKAFRGLLGQFHCSNCEGWVEVRPRKGDPEALSCSCHAVNLNLKAKTS